MWAWLEINQFKGGKLDGVIKGENTDRSLLTQIREPWAGSSYGKEEEK